MSSKALQKKMDELLYKEDHGLLTVSTTSRTLRKIMANKLAIAGFIVFALMVLMCAIAPLLTTYGPNAIDLRNRLSSPSKGHLMGTDQIGRDIWTRILYGGRISIFVGLGSALGAALIGVSLGTYAGYRRGNLDSIVMKLSEIMMSFPQIILVSILVTILGQSLWNLLLIFILTGWPSMYRMARSQMLSIREQEYIQALQAFGIKRSIIAFKHMLPNAIGPIFVNITLSTAMFILQEASLSFLGLGVPLETATWGNILNVAQDLTILREAWWVWLPVGLVITVFVMAVNFIGDGLRDAADPTQVG
ncbi:MAG: ABC transporter permease [Spirochaetia bacterium]|nr:ABC transporter permease [Spirochaetia bacterium]